MEWSLVGLAACITALAGAWKVFDERAAKRNGETLSRMDKKLDSISDLCEENRREILRDRLQTMLLLDSENKDTILAIAETYFLELRGDGEMWANFYNWAEKHKINTRWYEQVLAREREKEDKDECGN